MFLSDGSQCSESNDGSIKWNIREADFMGADDNRYIARPGRGRPRNRTNLQKRDHPRFKTLPISEIERTMPVFVLPISAALIIELLARGFQRVDDLAGLTALHAIKIPGMNGWHWQTIRLALGKKQFPEK